MGRVRRRGVRATAATIPPTAGSGRRVGLRAELPRVLAARSSALPAPGGGREPPARPRAPRGPKLLRRGSHPPPARDVEPQAPAASPRRRPPAPRRVAVQRRRSRCAPARHRRRDPSTPLGHRNARALPDDPLLLVPPRVYVGDLLGRTPGRDGKVQCPFHTDEHASLHAYPTGTRGWFCFSCRRGGTIYDLAAGVWGLQTRGQDFVELRTRLLNHYRRELSSRRTLSGIER